MAMGDRIPRAPYPRAPKLRAQLRGWFGMIIGTDAVLHIQTAVAGDPITGESLCGYPPKGASLSDPVLASGPAEGLTWSSVCSTCRARLTPR